jgi:hypothetical protein
MSQEPFLESISGYYLARHRPGDLESIFDVLQEEGPIAALADEFLNGRYPASAFLQLARGVAHRADWAGQLNEAHFQGVVDLIGGAYKEKGAGHGYEEALLAYGMMCLLYEDTLRLSANYSSWQKGTHLPPAFLQPALENLFKAREDSPSEPGLMQEELVFPLLNLAMTARDTGHHSWVEILKEAAGRYRINFDVRGSHETRTYQPLALVHGADLLHIYTPVDYCGVQGFLEQPQNHAAFPAIREMLENFPRLEGDTWPLGIRPTLLHMIDQSQRSFAKAKEEIQNPPPPHKPAPSKPVPGYFRSLLQKLRRFNPIHLRG